MEIFSKRFFFWGIFTDKERLENTVGFKTSVFRDVDVIIYIGNNKFNIKGVIAEFDVSDDDFYKILGILSLVEVRSYTLMFDDILECKNSKEGCDYLLAFFYVPSRPNLKYWNKFLERDSE